MMGKKQIFLIIIKQTQWIQCFLGIGSFKGKFLGVKYLYLDICGSLLYLPLKLTPKSPYCLYKSTETLPQSNFTQTLVQSLQLLLRNPQTKAAPDMITPLKTPVLPTNQDQYHQEYERQGNLQRTLGNSRGNFNSNTKKASWQAGVRESKQTLSTNYSFKDELSTLTVDGARQSLHDFTFHPSDIQNLPFKQSLPLKNQYKYSNKSIQCVIFYALIFNYLHLEEMKKNLSEITSISLRSYNLIKKSILNYDQILMKKQLQDYIFPHSAFRLIENKALSLKNRKQWLKNLIDKIDSSIVSQLVQLLLNDAKADNLLKSDPECIATKNPQSNLQELVNYLGIRVKYQSEFKICSYGKKKSSICISIKQQTQTNVFSLKRVSCYEDRS